MDSRAFRALCLAKVLLADGGTGTALSDAGFEDEMCEVLSISSRDAVREVHAKFVQAGSELVHTNTFAANRFRLAKVGAQERVAEINVSGVARAREAGALYVGGSVGPLGVRLAPYGRVSDQQALDVFAEQIAALQQAGADVLVLETFSDLSEAVVALQAAQQVAPNLAALVTMTFTRDDRTLLGETPSAAATALLEAGAAAIGANCSEGPDQVLRVLAEMQAKTGDLPLIAKPNAGGPQRRDGRTRYSASPEYVARYVPAYMEVGARVIGGCCGTGPAHIAALRRAIDDPTSIEAVRLEISDRGDHGSLAGEQGPVSKLSRALASKQWVITVEMEPPHSPSPARIIAAAETLRDAGATTVNVADSPRAQLRMAPWAAAHLIQDEAGIETILHFPTRGRNLLRIQSDLLAAHALGIRNLFSVLGDPVGPSQGDLGEVTPSGLVALVCEQLNAGIDRSGASLGEPTRFTIGCAANPNASDLDREIRVLKRKQDAGAAFALTQPVYEPEVLESFIRRYQETHGPLQVPLLVGLLPLTNSRHAEFLHNEIPGIEVPESVRKRVRGASDQRAEGVAIALELIAAMRDQVAGVYLMPAFRRYDAAAELIDRLL